ncbi:MAG: MFS transporter [Erysipelotrichaceae bacterium]|nr:MFS transporter [Erysipelotrichaceae bacterium]
MDNRIKEEVKTSSAVWLGAADCMIATLNNILTGGALTYFFVNHFGMDSKWSAMCWLLFGLWNAVNDPLFGYISDKTKSKLGRRIPYIRYGALAIAAVFVLAWVVWFPNGGDTQMFIQMLVALFLFDALYTAIATSLYVMPFEMAVTNEARSKIVLAKVIFGLIALSVPLFLLGSLEGILSESLQKFQMIMTVIGIAAGLIMFFSTFFYKEKRYTKEEEQYPLIQSIVTCFKNKNFLAFETISFSVTYIQTLLMMGLSYYFTAFNINMMFCYAAMFIGIIFGIWLWMKPGSKWGVKKSVVIMCLIFGIGLAVMMAVGNYQIAGIIGFLASGIGFAGGMYLIPLMNGDVVDYDEHLSGLRREGMYAGVNSFVCKPAISIANALFPIMLGWFGYNLNLTVAEQTDFAKFGIRISWLLIPVVFLLLCAFFISKFYKLDGSEWDETKQKLAKIHDEKQKAYEAEMLSRNK